MKFFISYTYDDAPWAHWVGFVLMENEHEVFVHEWEIEAGGNIPEWMERRLDECDRVIAIVSDAYINNEAYSQSERLAAYWSSPSGEPFLIPVIVSPTEKIPRLISNLKRLYIHDLVENHAEEVLISFVTPPQIPPDRPRYPGRNSNETT